MHQHGFRKHRSCETQLALFSHDILRTMHEGYQTDAIFLDFRKAFDSVPHCRLLTKVRAYGIGSQICEWLEDFLSNRTQYVVLDGECSSEVRVSSGVPQGSVVGPLLFSIYINDLLDRVDSNMQLFADDAVVYGNMSSLSDCRRIQDDLDRICDWCKEWQLTVNIDKRKLMQMNRKKNPVMFE